MNFRLLCSLLCLLFLFIAVHCNAELTVFSDSVQSTALITTEDGNWPALNGAGYLDAGEFVFEDNENGVWRYCSSTLKVEITRHTQTEKPKRIWYEAEVWSAEGGWDLVQAEDGKYVSTTELQPVIAASHGCVLAINSDELNYRWSKKDSSVGLAIRNGEILWEKTKTASYKGYPPLSNLALYEDGNMEVYDTAEKTAEEFIAMGVKHVLSFGPTLIRNGVLNETKCRLYDYSTSAARTAIGMVEKGHYWAIMVEARHKNSTGSTVWWVAQRMA